MISYLRDCQSLHLMPKKKAVESQYSYLFQPGYVPGEKACASCNEPMVFGTPFGVAQGMVFHRECCNKSCPYICRKTGGTNCYRCLKYHEK